MSTLAEFMIIASADNHPPILDKPMYDSWKSHMELYIQEWGKFVTDVKLARDLHTPNYDLLYAYFEQHEACANEARLMHKRFIDPLSLVAKYHQPSSDFNNYHSQYTTPQYQQQFSPPTHLIPEWGKFVTDVKLARDLHTPNYDLLYAYFEQHEACANEARLMHKRFIDPLSLVAKYHQPSSDFNNYHSQYTTPQYQQQFSPPTHHTQPFVPLNAYPPSTIPQQPQAEFLQLDSGFVVSTFLLGDDLIACMNKAIQTLSVVFSPRYPSTNNQLRSSSNPRNQATAQDGRVIVLHVQRRQGQNVVVTGLQGNASSS
nr:hypothetical protein [Tanacetum cinerariifolium]